MWARVGGAALRGSGIASAHHPGKTLHTKPSERERVGGGRATVWREGGHLVRDSGRRGGGTVISSGHQKFPVLSFPVFNGFSLCCTSIKFAECFS